MIGMDDLMGTVKLTDFMGISLNEKILVNLAVPILQLQPLSADSKRR